MTDPSGVDARRTVVRFGPDRRLTALTASGAVGAAFGAVVTSDGPGRILLVLAAVVLALYAATDIVYWPRITATADGLVIKAPGGSAQLAWADIERISAPTRLRLGLRSMTLEIDAGASLHVFSRRALGADPDTVVTLLAAHDPRR
jgi:PH (Pleckstrin Homology) domain-containing protein